MTLPSASQSSKPAEGPLQPSGSLLAQLGDELRRHPPFDEMDPAHVCAFVEASRQAYFAPGEVLLQTRVCQKTLCAALSKGCQCSGWSSRKLLPAM